MPSNLRITGSDLKLKVSWEAVLDTVLDLSVTTLKTSVGAASAGDLRDVLKSLSGIFRADEPDESKAWTLVALSFAKAIDDLRAPETNDATRKAVRTALNKTKKRIKDEEYFLEPDFFKRPTSLPLYKDMRADFIKAFKRFGNTQTEIGAKLDAAFNSAPSHVIRHAPEIFGHLRQIVINDFQPITQWEQDWQDYRCSLVHSFEVMPLFGQEDTLISLSQLYLKPRAIWQEKAQEEDHRSIASEQHQQDRPRHIVNLHADMTEWLKLQDTGRVIRLVRGGPGSGKSSFAKSFAAEQAKNMEVRPLLIELQKLRGEGNLVERIKELFVEKQEAFKDSPIEKDFLDNNRPHLLIFDGLDELARPESAGAKKLADDFLSDLDDLLSSLNSPTEIRARALVTGREPIMEAALDSRLGRRLKERDSFQIVGLEEIDPSKVKGAEDFDFKDQRPAWWQKYATAKNISLAVPPVLKNDKLGSLTFEPLLCYLLALSGKAEESHKRDIVNRNEIYAKLIGEVGERVWGDEPLGAQEVLDQQSDFRIILENIAIAAWRGGENRTATVVEFEKVIKYTDAEDVWAKFQDSFATKDHRDSFATLALTFFFRRGEGDGDGFEFTHKSFGEYLTASRLFQFIVQHQPAFKSARSMEEDVMRHWLRLTGEAPFTKEIFDFLEGEFEQLSQKDCYDLRSSLDHAMRLTLRDGMPVRLADGETWRLAEFRQRNSESALYYASALVSKKVAEYVDNHDLSKVFDGFSIESLFDRIKYKPIIETPLTPKFYGKLIYGQDIDSTIFFVASLMNLKIDRSLLSNVTFFDCIIDFILIEKSIITSFDFPNCKMNSCAFFYTESESVNFHFSDIEYANFTNCSFKDSNFDSTIFSRSVFDNCEFKNCSFVDSKLNGAHFINCTGITQDMIDAADGDSKTVLPNGLVHPDHWEIVPDEDLEDEPKDT